MKFTKLLALALVVVMAVFALASCGEPAETTAETPETTEAPETQAPETQAPETTGCTHKNSLKKTGNDKTPTCTEEGYVERKCTKCGEIVQEPIDKIAHAYSEVKSLDGKYVRKVCGMCKEVIVVDEAGAVVADASAIAFPLFAGTFEGVDTLADVAALFDGFGIKITCIHIACKSSFNLFYIKVDNISRLLISPLDLRTKRNNRTGTYIQWHCAIWSSDLLFYADNLLNQACRFRLVV